jgi:hypothetical protein
VREIVVYSRRSCHLCEDLIEELLRLVRPHDVGLRVLDVDTRADWKERFGLRVPVVMADGEELFCAHLDRARFDAWLAREQPESI